MTAIIVVLMKISITGMLWHETLGLGVFFLFLFHKLINYKTLSGLFKKFRKITARSKSMLVLDILLFIDFSVVVATGIMISQKLFESAFELTNQYFISTIHHSSAYIGLILISIHIGLHWSYIINTVKNKLHVKNASRIRAVLSRVLAVLIMLLGVQGSFNQNVLAEISQPLQSKNTASDSYSSGDENISNTQEYSASNSQTQTSVEDSASSVKNITLEEYLSSLFCTLCPKHCPLSSPQCANGQALAQEATEDYYSIYGDVSQSSDSSNTSAQTSGSVDDTVISDNENSKNGKHESYEKTSQLSEITSESYTATTVNINGSSETDADTAAKNIPIKNAAEYISIMGLYIGGTHYLVKIPKNKK
jgi:hypothetical protein